MVSRRKPRAGGFNVIEMMVTLAILAILAAVAVPSVRDFIVKQRLRTASSDLFNSLLRTRSEAVKLNRAVTLLPVSAANWEQGWGIASPIPNDQAFETHGVLPEVQITGPASVVFQGNGRVQGAAAPTFSLSATGVDDVRCIGLDLSGRPYQKRTAC